MKQSRKSTDNPAHKTVREHADRLSALRPFIVMEVLEKALALEREGRSIIHLEVGEPDFPTPPRIVRAATEALARGETHYTDSRGLSSSARRSPDTTSARTERVSPRSASSSRWGRPPRCSSFSRSSSRNRGTRSLSGIRAIPAIPISSDISGACPAPYRFGKRRLPAQTRRRAQGDRPPDPRRHRQLPLNPAGTLSRKTTSWKSAASAFP